MTSVCFRPGPALNQHMLVDLEDADDDADVMICTLTWKIIVDLGIGKIPRLHVWACLCRNDEPAMLFLRPLTERTMTHTTCTKKNPHLT